MLTCHFYLLWLYGSMVFIALLPILFTDVNENNNIHINDKKWGGEVWIFILEHNLHIYQGRF